MAVLPYAPSDTGVVLTALSRLASPIRLPSVLSFTVTNSADQTELPVELGADIAIHRRLLPVEISIAGVVTEFEPYDGAPVLFSRIIETRDAIELNFRLGSLLTVKFLGQSWPRMTIRSLSSSRDPVEREDVWRFEMTLRETRLASSLTVPSDSSALGDLTATTLEGGPQAGVTVGPEAASQVAGVLAGGV